MSGWQILWQPNQLTLTAVRHGCRTGQAPLEMGHQRVLRGGGVCVIRLRECQARVRTWSGCAAAGELGRPRLPTVDRLGRSQGGSTRHKSGAERTPLYGQAGSSSRRRPAPHMEASGLAFDFLARVYSNDHARLVVSLLLVKVSLLLGATACHMGSVKTYVHQQRVRELASRQFRYMCETAVRIL